MTKPLIHIWNPEKPLLLKSGNICYFQAPHWGFWIGTPLGNRHQGMKNGMSAIAGNKESINIPKIHVTECITSVFFQKFYGFRSY